MKKGESYRSWHNRIKIKNKKKEEKQCWGSAKEFIDLLPLWPLASFLALFFNEGLDVEFANASDEIHVMRAHHGGAKPDFVGNVKSNGDGEGEVDAKEALETASGSEPVHIKGRDRDVELGDEDEAVEEEANVGADDAWLGAKSQFVEAVALDFPALAEANVCEADGEPGEDCGQGGEGEEPVEGLVLELTSCAGEEGEEAEGGGKGDGDEGTALAINVGEDARGLVLFCQRGEGTGGAVDGGVADGEDGNHDDGIEDGWKTLDPSILDGDDEWGGDDVGSVAIL